MNYVLPTPPNFTEEHDAGHIHTWLASQGVNVQGVSIVRANSEQDEGTTLNVVVEADTDPKDILALFQPEPSAEEAAAQELEAIDISTADLAQLRHAVGLMKSLMAKDTPIKE